MAERQGFEPWRRSPAYTLSRRAPSTTRPPLRSACLSLDLGVMQEQKEAVSGLFFIPRTIAIQCSEWILGQSEQNGLSLRDSGNGREAKDGPSPLHNMRRRKLCVGEESHRSGLGREGSQEKREDQAGRLSWRLRNAPCSCTSSGRAGQLCFF